MIEPVVERYSGRLRKCCKLRLTTTALSSRHATHLHTHGRTTANQLRINKLDGVENGRQAWLSVCLMKNKKCFHF